MIETGFDELEDYYTSWIDELSDKVAALERERDVLLPDTETRQAIRDLVDDAAQTEYDEDNAIDIERVTTWLQRLEANNDDR